MEIFNDFKNILCTCKIWDKIRFVLYHFSHVFSQQVIGYRSMWINILKLSNVNLYDIDLKTVYHYDRYRPTDCYKRIEDLIDNIFYDFSKHVDINIFNELLYQVCCKDIFIMYSKRNNTYDKLEFNNLFNQLIRKMINC